MVSYVNPFLLGIYLKVTNDHCSWYGLTTMLMNKQLFKLRRVAL